MCACVYDVFSCTYVNVCIYVENLTQVVLMEMIKGWSHYTAYEDLHSLFISTVDDLQIRTQCTVFGSIYSVFHHHIQHNINLQTVALLS